MANNNFNISNLLNLSGDVTQNITNVANTINNVTESMNLSEGIGNFISAGTSIFSNIMSSVLTPENIENTVNAATAFLSSSASTLASASQGLFGMLADNGLIDRNTANTWASQTTAWSSGATSLFSGMVGAMPTDTNQIVAKMNNISDNYVETLGVLTDIVNEALTNPNAQTVMAGNKAASDLVPIMTGGSKDMITSLVQLPSFTIDKLHYALNDAFDSVLKYKNQSLGIDRTGAHTGDTITTVGDSVLSGWLLPDYMEKLKNGTNVIDGVVALQNIEGSAPILMGQELGAKVNQMQYPGIRTDELRYVLDDSFRNTTSIPDYKKEFLDAHRAEYLNYLSNSDTVVLDIGWNNVQNVGTAFGSIGNYFDNAFNNDLPLDQKISKAVSSLPEYLPNILSSVGRAVGSYVIDYPVIMSKIHDLNPDATLCVVGGYNPLEDADLSAYLGMNVDDDITSGFATALFDTTTEAYKKALCLLYPGEAVYADMSGIEIRGNSASDLLGGNTDWHATETGVIEQANKLVSALGGQSTLNTFDVRSADDDALQLRYGAALDKTLDSIKALFKDDNNSI